MTRVLIAYYSLTGHTRQVAEALAAALDADLEEIEEPVKRAGARHLWTPVELLLGLAPRIKPPTRAAGDYDLVVVGAPVWAGTMATPVRTYLTAIRDQAPKAAYFVTAGGAGTAGALRRMEALLDRPAAATLEVTEPELKNDAWRAKVEAFAGRVRAAAAPEQGGAGA